MSETPDSDAPQPAAAPVTAPKLVLSRATRRPPRELPKVNFFQPQPLANEATLHAISNEYLEVGCKFLVNYMGPIVDEFFVIYFDHYPEVRRLLRADYTVVLDRHVTLFQWACIEGVAQEKELHETCINIGRLHYRFGAQLVVFLEAVEMIEQAILNVFEASEELRLSYAGAMKLNSSDTGVRFAREPKKDEGLIERIGDQVEDVIEDVERTVGEAVVELVQAIGGAVEGVPVIDDMWDHMVKAIIDPIVNLVAVMVQDIKYGNRIAMVETLRAGWIGDHGARPEWSPPAPLRPGAPLRGRIDELTSGFFRRLHQEVNNLHESRMLPRMPVFGRDTQAAFGEQPGELNAVMFQEQLAPQDFVGTTQVGLPDVRRFPATFQDNLLQAIASPSPSLIRRFQEEANYVIDNLDDRWKLIYHLQEVGAELAAAGWQVGNFDQAYQSLIDTVIELRGLSANLSQTFALLVNEDVREMEAWSNLLTAVMNSLIEGIQIARGQRPQS